MHEILSNAGYKHNLNILLIIIVNDTILPTIAVDDNSVINRGANTVQHWSHFPAYQTSRNSIDTSMNVYPRNKT